jgi:phosphohistidine phosphatase
VRYLIVVRHTKSSPAPPGGSDFDRVLSGRGRKQCKQLRAWADDNDALARYGPVTALVSSAARTRETFERGFEGTSMIAQHIYEKSIYNGTREVSGDDLLEALIDIDPLTTSLMVVAHNPSVHELAIVLARALPDSLRFHNYALGGAYVFAMASGEPLSRQRYEIVDSFIPD